MYTRSVRKSKKVKDRNEFHNSINAFRRKADYKDESKGQHK